MFAVLGFAGHILVRLALVFTTAFVINHRSDAPLYFSDEANQSETHSCKNINPYIINLTTSSYSEQSLSYNNEVRDGISYEYSGGQGYNEGSSSVVASEVVSVLIPLAFNEFNNKIPHFAYKPLIYFAQQLGHIPSNKLFERYDLYRYPGFRDYIKTLQGYENHLKKITNELESSHKAFLRGNGSVWFPPVLIGSLS